MGQHSNVGDHSLDFGFRQSISVGSHKRRFVQHRVLMRDDRGEVGITHLVQRVAVRRSASLRRCRNHERSGAEAGEQNLGSLSRFRVYLVKVKSALPSPATATALDWVLAPSCQATPLYWPSGTPSIL